MSSCLGEAPCKADCGTVITDDTKALFIGCLIDFIGLDAGTHLYCASAVAVAIVVDEINRFQIVSPDAQGALSC